MKRIAGYVFYQEDHRRLTYRKSWWSYALGCVIAAAVFVACLVVLLDWLKGRTFYVGLSRGSPGTPVSPAEQTWQQFAQSTVCPCLFLLPFLILPVVYLIAGSDEQRNPFVFDRERDRVSYGRKELCKLSAITLIRLVEAPGSTGGRRMAARTGIFAWSKGPPWSIELGCFSRFHTAQTFAQEISAFLNVELYDDPIIQRKRRGRGFEVVLRPADHPNRPDNQI